MVASSAQSADPKAEPGPPGRRGGGAIARTLIWFLALLLSLPLVGTVWRTTYGGGPEPERLGTAAVVDCAELGPIGLYGYGAADRCTADVRWDDGASERLEFPPGQLRADDAGAPVPVYLDLPDGRGENHLGRNDTAADSVLRVPAMLLVGLLVLVLAVRAFWSAYRLIRPAGPGAPTRVRKPRGTRAGQQQDAAEREERHWPIDDADRAAAVLPKVVWRVRLIAGWLLLAIVLVLFAAIPRYDAPRARAFNSPWPQIDRANLVDVPPMAWVILGGIAAAGLLAISAAVRDGAARAVRYGPAYLGRNLPRPGSGKAKGGKAKRRKKNVMVLVEEELAELRARGPRQRVMSYAIGGILAALGVWAVVRAAGSVPAGAPLAVWVACLRDGLLLLSLAGIWLATVETAGERFERFLGAHRGTPSRGAPENGAQRDGPGPPGAGGLDR